MKRIRVIPVLLIQDGGLVKSVKFKNHQYLGDPINAVRIFNEKEVDEIIVLDISATKAKRGPNINHIKQIASEAFMPLAYGGGVSTLEQVNDLIQAGVEKVVLNTAAIKDSGLISSAARFVGTQSIVVSLDVRKSLFGGYKVFTRNASENAYENPVVVAKRLEDEGAGELLIQSVEKDGTFGGYDLDLIKSVSLRF